jgi:hypothetical protein
MMVYFQRVRWSQLDYGIQERYRRVFSAEYTPKLTPAEFQHTYHNDKLLSEAFWRHDRELLPTMASDLTKSQEAAAVVVNIGQDLFSMVKPTRVKSGGGVTVYLAAQTDYPSVEMLAFASGDDRGVRIVLSLPDDTGATRSAMMITAVRLCRGLVSIRE